MQCWLHLYKITKTLMSSLWGMCLGCEIIPDMQSKCIIQRCKAVSLCNGSAFSTQLLRRNSRGKLSLNLSSRILFCAISKYYCKEAFYIRYIKSPNRQLMHTSPHFVVRLKSRFCTQALIFFFDVNIYSCSLRLFKVDLVISLLPATYRQ